MADEIKRIFDQWAKSGRSEAMEKEHGKSVLKFLSSVRFDEPFSFLDIGCGNGWVVRWMSRLENCRKAVGIDKSGNMIKNARSKSDSKKEVFVRTDLESWKYTGRFDCIFAMESIYYSESVEGAIAKACRMLKEGGRFFCGTDFYSENRATSGWPRAMNVPMHLLSKAEWRRIFSDAGLRTSTRQIRDPNSRKKWRRDLGTLFVIGKK